MTELNDLTLKVSTRMAIGRQACKKLRAAGVIPAVYYGKDMNKPYSFEEREFRQLMRSSAGSAALFRLQSADGEDELALIKELQRHPLTDAILHVDFIQVTRGQELQTKVPVVIVGEAFGVKHSGGILEVNMNEVEVRCRPSLLPSSVELDVSDLDLGDNLQVKDLEQIEGVFYSSEPNQVLVACVGSASGRAAVEDEEELLDGEDGEKSEGTAEESAEGSEGEGETGKPKEPEESEG